MNIQNMIWLRVSGPSKFTASFVDLCRPFYYQTKFELKILIFWSFLMFVKNG